jgi:hypothetical protein
MVLLLLLRFVCWSLQAAAQSTAAEAAAESLSGSLRATEARFKALTAHTVLLLLSCRLLLKLLLLRLLPRAWQAV